MEASMVRIDGIVPWSGTPNSVVKLTMASEIAGSAGLP